MNILQLTAHVNTGGITSYLYTLSSGLIRQGHEVILVASNGDMSQRLSALGIDYIDLPIRFKSMVHPKSVLYLPRLCRLIKDKKIDIIHAHTRTTQVIGSLLSLLTGIPLVTTCHGFFKPHFFRRIFGCWGKRVIAISPMVARHLSNDFKLPPTRIRQINNGIDLLQFRGVSLESRINARQRLGLQQAIIIGLIARFSSVKGIDVLIEAFPSVLEQYPQALLLIVGQGPEEVMLKNRVNQLGLTPHVRFENIVKQTAEILPAFDVVIAPSRQEGLGLSVMEAMASALPVIASAVGGLKDLITDGVDGYLIKPDEPQLLGRVINEVLRFPQGAMRIGQQARQKIITGYTADKMVAQTLDVYHEVV